MRKIISYFILYFIFIFPNAVYAAPPTPAASASSKTAVGRNWVINATSFVSLLLTNRVKPDDKISSDGSGQSFDFEVGRSFGRIEFGPRLGYFNASPLSGSTRGTTLGGYFRYNFLANISGEIVIPYARVEVLTANVDTDGDSFDITTLAISAGGTWFPINDSVALSGFLIYRDSKLTGAKINGFALATGVAFYL